MRTVQLEPADTTHVMGREVVGMEKGEMAKEGEGREMEAWD